MYYSSGNYEAFARPKKPEGVDQKSAYIIGSGLAALTAACYLVRDGQMKGEHVHVFEKDPIPGGACDGYKYDIGYGSVNLNRNRCMDCGYEDAQEALEVCPSCGSTHIDRLQRITGYLVGATDRWNHAKLAELHDRVVHK